jgi:hypothetical protein
MSDNTTQQHTPVLRASQLASASAATASEELLILRVFAALIFIAAGIVVLLIGQNLLIEHARLAPAGSTVVAFAGLVHITLGKLGFVVTLFSFALFFYAYRLFKR